MQIFMLKMNFATGEESVIVKPGVVPVRLRYPPKTDVGTVAALVTLTKLPLKGWHEYTYIVVLQC